MLGGGGGLGSETYNPTLAKNANGGSGGGLIGGDGENAFYRDETYNNATPSGFGGTQTESRYISGGFGIGGKGEDAYVAGGRTEVAATMVEVVDMEFTVVITQEVEVHHSSQDIMDVMQ